MYRNIDRERIDTWTGTLTVKLPGKWIKTPTETGTWGRIGTWIETGTRSRNMDVGHGQGYGQRQGRGRRHRQGNGHVK